MTGLWPFFWSEHTFSDSLTHGRSAIDITLFGVATEKCDF